MSDILVQRVYDLKIAGFDQALQNIKKLTAEFNKLDQAKRQLNEQLKSNVDASAFEQAAAKTKVYNAELKALQKQQQQNAKEALALAKAQKDHADYMAQVKAASDEWEESLKKSTIAEEQLAGATDLVTKAERDYVNAIHEAGPIQTTALKTKKDAVTVDKDLEAAKRKLSKAEADNAVEIKKYSVLTAEANKATKQQALEELGLTDVYAKLTARMAEAKREAKNLQVEAYNLRVQMKTAPDGASFQKLNDQFKDTTARAKAASQEAASLDKEIKRIDKSVGDSQRNIGNYSSAFGTLWGALRKVAYIIPGLGLGGLIALLGEGVVALLKGKNAVSEFTAKLQALANVNEKAIESLAQLKVPLDAFVKLMNDASISADTKTKAMDRMIEKYPLLATALDGERINVEKLKLAYAELTKEIEKKVQVEAAQSLSADQQKEVLKFTVLREELEDQIIKKRKTNFDINAFSKTSKDILFSFNNPLATPTIKGDIEIEGTKFSSAQIFDALSKREKEANSKYQNYLDILSQKQSELIVLEDQHTKQANEAARKRAANIAQSKNELQALIKGIDDEAATLKEGDPHLKDLQKARDSYQKRLDDIFRTSKVSPGSKLDPTDKDALSRIEANMNAELSAENTRITELKKKHKLSYQEEIDYLKNIEAISVKFLNQKIALFKNEKDLNAKELETLNKFKNDKSNIQLKTQEEIEALSQKEFEKQATASKKQLDAKISQINLGLNVIQADPNRSDEQKVQARAIANELTYTETKKYYDSLIVLAKQYKLEVVNIEQEKIKALNDLLKNSTVTSIELGKARISDIDKEGKEEIDTLKINFSKARQAIIANDKLTKSERKRQLDQLDRAEQRSVLSAELKTLLRELKVKKDLLDLSLITNQEYLDQLQKVQEKAEQVQKSTADSKISLATLSLPGQGGLGNLIKSKTEGKIKAGTDKDGATVDGSELLGELLAQSYQVAQQAMQSYFDAEEARIQRSKELAYQRIDLEKQQALATAQSQAEKDAIEKEAAVKKQKADREAGEKLKKVKRAEAGISFATELAGIAAAAAQNPANGVTLGAAGIAMYALLATLAGARYALNLKTINSQQFAGGGKAKPTIWQRVSQFFGGGKVQPVKLSDGKIVATQNIPELSNGDNILATVRKGEVVLNERQQKDLGGDDTFKRIGVPGFAGGGTTDNRKYFTYANGGYTSLDLLGPLGENLKPPFNPSSFLNPGSHYSDDMKKVLDKIDQQSENLKETARQIHERIDKIKVVNDPIEAAAVNSKFKKAEQLAKL
jgi:hypothetical protein